MRALTVRYERLINIGNYEHAKAAIEIALEDGDDATAAMEKAKLFVSKQLGVEAPKTSRILSETERESLEKLLAKASQFTEPDDNIPF